MKVLIMPTTDELLDLIQQQRRDFDILKMVTNKRTDELSAQVQHIQEAVNLIFFDADKEL